MQISPKMTLFLVSALLLGTGLVLIKFEGGMQLIYAPLGLLGLVMVERGTWGKVIDDHPTCRNCGFDLFDSKDKLDICPECRSNVTKSDNLRIGNRVKNRGLIIAGMVAVAASALLSAYDILW